MKEFMLLIRTQGDHIEGLSPEEQQQHIQKVTNYIGSLMKDGKLKGAQPLEMQEGKIISGSKGNFKDGPFNETKEVIAGYFLITAKNLEEAIDIAKANPVFETETGATIEVRSIKVVEGING